MTDNHLPHEGLAPLNTFCKDRLNSPTPEHLATLCSDEAILAAVKAFCSCTKTDYNVLSVALNTISLAIKHLCLPEEEVVFEWLIVESKNMPHHPNGFFKCRPDLIVASQDIIKALLAANATPSWHHLKSLAEEKLIVDRKAGAAQCGTYLGLATQSRPDMIGMFGIAASPREYRIQYSCPSGLETSEEFGWDNLVPLIQYMYTLYRPHSGQAYHDPTITLSEGLQITDAPKWDIQAERDVYKNCTVKLVGLPWRRMHWVAKTDGKAPFVIKDTFRDSYSSSREGDFYTDLGKDGYPPGIAIKVAAFDVEADGKPITIKVGDCERIKTRLVMATSGDSLSACKSVVTFLKIMYDILEAHRWVVRERKILHRDISYNNIIINTVNAIEVPPFKEEGRPIYIAEVLDKREFASAFGTLIDWDNAARLDGSLRKSVDGRTRLRTGTPRFIARSVASRRILPDNMWFDVMPDLPEGALQCYQSAFPTGKDPLRSLSDTESETFHSGNLDPRKLRRYREPSNLEKDFDHRGCHDAESALWCIIFFLLRALPKGSDPYEDAHNADYNALYKQIANHEIGDGIGCDSRSAVLFVDNWSRRLHKGLERFAPLLFELANQVKPEYALLTPPPDPLHLHEAMQRILFKHIYQFHQEKYDVELAVGVARATIEGETKLFAPITLPTDDGQHYSQGQKRQSEALGGTLESGQAKRTRTTVS